MARKKKINLMPEEQLNRVITDIEQTKETLKALEKSKKEKCKRGFRNMSETAYTIHQIKERQMLIL